MSEISIRHNPGRSRFEVLDGDRVIGKAAYQEYADGGRPDPQRIFYHTVIEDEYGGQGLGGKLASHALKETVDHGIRIVPVCPYIKSYLGKHPEFGEGVTEPTPEHLEFLRTRLEGRGRQ
jgi:uncharacterized protein